MADMSITEAAEIAKSLARQFASFAKLEEASSSLVVLMSRHDGLTREVAALHAEHASFVKKLQELKPVHEQLVTDHTALQQKHQAVDTAVQGLLAEKAQQEAKRTEDMQLHVGVMSRARADFKQLNTEFAAARAAQAAAVQDHEKTLTELKDTHAVVVNETSSIRDQLTALKARITPLLA